MRSFLEPSARNLLRKPLVLGVPFPGLLGLSFIVLSIFILGGSRVESDVASLAVAVIGYTGLRVFTRFSAMGWEESLLFRLERMRRVKEPDGILQSVPAGFTLASPDTLTEADLLVVKDELSEKLRALRPSESWCLTFNKDADGTSVEEFSVTGQFDLHAPLDELAPELVTEDACAYSLIQLPVVTDPLWTFALVKSLPVGSKVLLRFEGLRSTDLKKRLEHVRRSNAQSDSALTDIDSAVSFEEASLVLQGLSRGEDQVVEVALVVLVPQGTELDETLFHREKNPLLPVVSVLGIRRRFHRSHWVRTCTAADLIPNICDPRESGSPILETVRCAPLYFSPQDTRLEALHWLVVGASGSGKSFFTGLVLKRMLDQGIPMSVFFVDHNRSFRRLVLHSGSPYFEPDSLSQVEFACAQLPSAWDVPGSVSGIELSDLDLSEKKAATTLLLSKVEAYLRTRETTHPVYLVLDECWNFMRDEPVLVQRAFREFRKLNGAVIAITQSLSDFLMDECGQSIFQNAPIRILLRQGEDVSRYQGVLGLNSVEAGLLSRLRQSKGAFSECLIKTPFLSRLGRLHPTEAEHKLLRTDNLRAELIQEAKGRRRNA